MEGKVIGWNTSSKEGVIRSSEGERYSFTMDDWRDERSPYKNLKVDFEPEDRVAKEIFVVSAGFDDGLDKVKGGVNAAREIIIKNEHLKKLTEHGLFNITPVIMMTLVFFLGFIPYADDGGYSSDGISAASGVTGFLFVVGSLGFIFAASFGLKPIVTKVLGLVVTGVLALNILIALMYLLQTLDMDYIEDAYMYLELGFNVFGMLSLVVITVLSIVCLILPKKVNPNYASEGDPSDTAVDINSSSLTSETDSERIYAHINYALMALFILTGGISGIAALIFAYIRKGSITSELYQDHYRYIIRTLWFTLLWTVIAIATVAILVGVFVGILVAVVASIWLIYRVIKGWLRMSNGRLMY